MQGLQRTARVTGPANAPPLCRPQASCEDADFGDCDKYGTTDPDPVLVRTVAGLIDISRERSAFFLYFLLVGQDACWLKESSWPTFSPSSPTFSPRPGATDPLVLAKL